MIPNISCPQCHNALSPNDQFCSNCGAKIEWEHPAASTPTAPPTSTHAPKSQACPLCGQQNPPDASSCESCGAALATSAPPPSAVRKNKRLRGGTPSPSAPLKSLQSWKIPAGVALILVAVLVIVRYSQRTEEPASTTQTPQAVNRETEALEKTITENPKDDQALLRLANLYYDSRQYARAIMMYDRYLEINPSNPDARVDLGISYFEMGLIDTSNREEYYTTAKNEMQKALTYNPRHQLAYYNLGMVSLHSGNMQEANEWFSKCAEIDSTTEVGKRARQLVHQHSFNNPS